MNSFAIAAKCYPSVAEGLVLQSYSRTGSVHLPLRQEIAPFSGVVFRLALQMSADGTPATLCIHSLYIGAECTRSPMASRFVQRDDSDGAAWWTASRRDTSRFF